MSKYQQLWDYIAKQNCDLVLSFDEIRNILGFDIDHSFLKYKKELIDYGYQVSKISMKQEKVYIEQINNKP